MKPLNNITKMVDGFKILQYKESEWLNESGSNWPFWKARIIPYLKGSNLWPYISGTTVLCHHSPRWISLTFRQHPLYSVSDPYICATALYKPCYSSLPSPTLLISTFCFWPTFAYAQAEPPEPHHWLICNRHIYHIYMSRSQARPCGSITSVTSCGMWWKARQWRF